METLSDFLIILSHLCLAAVPFIYLYLTRHNQYED